jgi:hypothetical protein
MASEVDICNLALSHLGDDATVASIDPPEGSAQAEHCARFYPIARDTLLEMHSWNFATRRAALALLADDGAQWTFTYEQPADCLRVLAVMHVDAPSDLAVPAVNNPGRTFPIPQDFVCETDILGRKIVYTEQEDAMARFIAFVTDTARFSPMFVTALSWKLAALLAGPVIKGDAGRAEAKRCEQMFAQWFTQAITSDANQRQVAVPHAVGWMAVR